MPHTLDAGPSWMKNIAKNPGSKKSEANENRLKGKTGRLARFARMMNMKHEKGESKREERTEHGR